MSFREEIDLLVRQNEALVRTLAIMGSRLDQALKQLSVISSLTLIPVQAQDLPTAARTILEILLMDLTDIRACSLLLHEPESNRLRLLAALGSEQILGTDGGPYNLGLSFEVGQGVAGQAFLKNEPRFVARSSPDGDSLLEDTGLTTPEALACVPLSVLGQTIGVLNVSFTRPVPFDQPRQRDLVLLGGVVANVLQAFVLKSETMGRAASLANQVNECQEEIWQRKQIEQALAQDRDALERKVALRAADLARINENLRIEISQHLRTSEALQKSENRYRELFNNISDFIFTHDLEGRLLSINPAASKCLGIPGHDLTGRLLTDLMEPDRADLFDAQYLAPLRESGRAEGTFVLQAADKTERYLAYRSCLVRGGEPGPYVTGSGRDVTEEFLARQELKRLETQLLQSQKMEAVGTLASGIAHDFNNILQAIGGYVQLLLHTPPGHSPDHRHLTGIDTAARRASELVRRLLTFSRKVEPVRRPLDVNREVRQAVALLERTIPRMIRIETCLDPDIQPVLGDATQIEQVLMNLGTNARDAMPDGGSIVIETKNVTLDQEYTREYVEIEPGPYVHISFADSGQGMDETVRAHVFEPFFTTKGPGSGTGLGLSTAYGIIKAHDGHVTISSQVGQGTTFDVYLPAARARDLVGRDVDGGRQEIPRGRETILLVDDERPILETGQEILGQYGYSTVIADGGEQALAVFRELGPALDLVILDLGMPGMGGWSCLQEMLTLAPRVKVLVASGYADCDLERVMSAGACGFIAKPFHLTDMLRKVRQVLDGI